MKQFLTYTLLLLFTLTLSFKSLLTIGNIKDEFKSEICFDRNCEDECNDTSETGEFNYTYYTQFNNSFSFFLNGEINTVADLVVYFDSSKYCKTIYSPPETDC